MNFSVSELNISFFGKIASCRNLSLPLVLKLFFLCGVGHGTLTGQFGYLECFKTNQLFIAQTQIIIAHCSKPLLNTSRDTVDGRNPAPVDMVNIPFVTWFYTSQVVSRISSINGRSIGFLLKTPGHAESVFENALGRGLTRFWANFLGGVFGSKIMERD